MKTKSVYAVALPLAIALGLSGCGMDSTVGSGYSYPCRDEMHPSYGSMLVRYSNPANFDTVIILLDPRARGEYPYEWSPDKGTRIDEVKGLGFVKYWVTARYVRGGDTVDVFDSETVGDGKSTNSSGCVTYDPQGSVSVEVEKWPR